MVPAPGVQRDIPRLPPSALCRLPLPSAGTAARSVARQGRASAVRAGEITKRRCRAYMFPIVINFPIDVSVHARFAVKLQRIFFYTFPELFVNSRVMITVKICLTCRPTVT